MTEIRRKGPGPNHTKLREKKLGRRIQASNFRNSCSHKRRRQQIKASP
jgi:hypothetical protein